MSLEITGKLLVKYDTQQVSDKFKKREFVLELAEEINGNLYTNFAKMQLVQNKCEILDRYNVGDVVKVTFNIKGNRWEKDGRVNYITSLDAWRIEYANNPNAAPANNQAGYQQNNQQGYQQAPQQQPAYSNQQNYGNQQGYGNNNYNAPAQGFGSGSEPADDLPF